MSELSSTPGSDTAGLFTPASQITVGLGKISLALRSQAWQQGWAQDLTPTQGQVLSHLLAHPGERLGALAQALGIRPSTASEAVTALEHKALVEKDTCPTDGRRLELQLTAAGRAAAEKVSHWPGFLVAVVEGLSSAEQGLLLRVLQRMIRELQLRGEIAVAQMCTTCRYFQPYCYPGSSEPHYCALVEAAFGDRQLRIDCPDHQAADPAEADQAWRRFSAGPAAT
ncbi:MAG TPA: MarR family winged helix-turn-helix transcriptional regulator [Thermoanaerobaculia bacterium]|nr:MarR family winged helix-turn-helix transcriptional regulator [Thermoanaerobaculia bacterium]